MAAICYYGNVMATTRWRLFYIFNSTVIDWTFFCGAAAQRGLWPTHSRGFWITHNDAPHSAGLLWTSGLSVIETSTWQHNTHNRQTSMPPRVGFEPTISAGERPHTHVLDRAATGTGLVWKWRRTVFGEVYSSSTRTWYVTGRDW